jgi:hypothetical protein
LNFYVRAYLTHWAGTEFVYPTDFIPSVRPSDPLPAVVEPATYLIGEAAHGPLAPGADDYVAIRWPAALVPPESVVVDGSPVTWHPCLLAEITPHDGPSPTGNHVWDDNNLAQRNISIDYVPDDVDSFATVVVIGNIRNRAELLDLVIDRGELPRQVRLFVDVVPSTVKARLRQVVEARSLRPIAGVPAKRKLTEKLRAEIERFSRYTDLRHVTVGNAKGRESVFLIDRRARRIRLPLPRASFELVPLIIGGEITAPVPKGSYTISIRQFDENGRASGAAAVELRFG